MRGGGSGGLCKGSRWRWLVFVGGGGRLLQRAGVALVDERQRLHQLSVQLRLRTEGGEGGGGRVVRRRVSSRGMVMLCW